MSSDSVALSLHNLGKSYRVATLKDQPYSFVEMLTGKLRHPFRRPDERVFWALRELSLEIAHGDTVGIIGRNGAGKSTLLKILSRITDPSEGEVAVYGRVGSLLEVGTGFHPELTGRENVFLNGAILGMRRHEIARQFDAIVAFSGVEEFLETPVKRYSSGMYVRLAFAVAAHLEPEILLVDEVLAVGDAEFQQKCLNKMREEATSGRAVMFVSHSMAAVQNLCKTCLLLEQGRLTFYGETGEAIDRYLESFRRSTEDAAATLDARRSADASRPQITAVRLLDSAGKSQTHLTQGQAFHLEISVDAPGSGLERPVVGVAVNHLTHGTVGAVDTQLTGSPLGQGPYRHFDLRCSLKSLPLLQGMYTLDVWLSDGFTQLDALPACLSFSVEETDLYGTGRAAPASKGILYLEPTWELLSED